METVIFEKQTLAFIDTGMGLFLWQAIPAAASLTEGETYVVEWDGGRHSCAATAASLNGTDGIGLGNFALAGVGENNNLPFLFGTALDGSFSAIYTTENDASNSFAIYHVTEEDKQYLIWGSTLKEIGNAIREKTGGTASLAPTDMPTEIRGITGGGGGSDADVVYITFMSHDGATQLYKKPVVVGDDSLDPVTNKLIDTPTRESTAEYNYTFAGWATTANGGLNENALNAVTADRTVYANYIATIRTYAVRFFDGDTQVGDTQYVAYGANATAPEVEKEGFQLDGWQPNYVNITADTDCYAQWSEKLTFGNATWAQIAEISEAGEAANYFAVGDTKQIPYGDDYITVAVAGFDHDDLSDGSGKAGISIICMTISSLTTVWRTNSVLYYNSCNARSALSTIFNNLPAELQAVIREVNKTYETTNATGTSPTTGIVSDALWLPSAAELGYDWSNSGFTTNNLAKLGNKYDLFKSGDITRNNDRVLSNVTIGTTGTNSSYWVRNFFRRAMNEPSYVRYDPNYGNSHLTYSGYNFKSDAFGLRFGFCI